MAQDLLALRARVHLAAARGGCWFRSIVGTEAVSRPFQYELEVLAEDIDLDAARASEALLELADVDGRERTVHGVVEGISVSPTEWEDRNLYRLSLVPEPYLLRHRHGFRIFQALSVPDICRRVFEGAGLPSERFEWRLSASYAPRELCVQYDESEWDFVSRLCEAEGIWYRFEHRTDGHTMVFGDDSARTPRIDSSPLPFAFAHTAALGARAYAAHDGLVWWRTTFHSTTTTVYARARTSRQRRVRTPTPSASGTSTRATTPTWPPDDASREPGSMRSERATTRSRSRRRRSTPSRASGSSSWALRSTCPTVSSPRAGWLLGAAPTRSSGACIPRSR